MHILFVKKPINDITKNSAKDKSGNVIEREDILPNDIRPKNGLKKMALMRTFWIVKNETFLKLFFIKKTF